MGVFKRLEDVPDSYRFERFAEQYEGQDVWGDYLDSLPSTYDSDHYHASLRKAGHSWKAHMADRGRHHALGTPEDVETWCVHLAKTRTLGTVNKEYFVRVEGLYDWLQYHTDHPHCYQPVLMAAAEYETARMVWRTKFDCGGDHE